MYIGFSNLQLLVGVFIAVSGVSASKDSCPANSLWPSGPGKAVPNFKPDRTLTALLDSISVKRIEKTIEKLVSFETRHTLSTQTSKTRGIGAARDWIAKEIRSYGGRLEVTVPGYIQEPEDRITFPVLISNVVATLPGTTDPNRVYVVSGHYDSLRSDFLSGEGAAPGANDDASGVAVSMELARLFAKSKFPATIIFAAVAGEEQGLYGSAYLASQLKAAGKDVQAMFTNDIVGSSVGDDGQVDAHSVRLFAQGLPVYLPASVQTKYANVGGENDSPARELGRFVESVASGPWTDMTVRVIYRLDRYLRGGDHRSFLEAGFPAARFTEPNENFAHQHQDVRVEDGLQYGDLLEFVDFKYTTRVAKVNAATMWALASAPGTPKNVKVITGQLGNDSTFTWDLVKGAVGYEVLWRPTNQFQWENFLAVGNTGKATVNLSKDNVVFGIRAVGANGYKSPAAFPL